MMSHESRRGARTWNAMPLVIGGFMALSASWFSTAAEPAHAADTPCYQPKVDSISGPTQLRSGSLGTYTVKVSNTNPPGVC
jgi:hypothetical protein